MKKQNVARSIVYGGLAMAVCAMAGWQWWLSAKPGIDHRVSEKQRAEARAQLSSQWRELVESGAVDVPTGHSTTISFANTGRPPFRFRIVCRGTAAEGETPVHFSAWHESDVWLFKNLRTGETIERNHRTNPST